MRATAARFWSSEEGAVTVDWVILTAAIVGLGLIIIVPIAFTTDSAATSMAQFIGTQSSGYVSQR
jgi:hypothetical protein